jgi:hypothetical protein
MAARDMRLGCRSQKPAWHKHRRGYGRAPAPSKRTGHAICNMSLFWGCRRGSCEQFFEAQVASCHCP